MQCEKEVVKLEPREADEIVAFRGIVGFALLGVVVGTWSESWLLALLVILGSTSLFALHEYEKLTLGGLTLAWGYIGHSVGIWLDGAMLSLLLATVMAGCSYFTYARFAELVKSRGLGATCLDGRNAFLSYYEFSISATKRLWIDGDVNFLVRPGRIRRLLSVGVFLAFSSWALGL